MLSAGVNAIYTALSREKILLLSQKAERQMISYKLG